jgi:TonB family protein
MIVRKSKSLKVSITMSILFHAVVLFSIVWIKLGSEYNTSERLNVTLLKNNKTKLLQRSTPARAIPSFSVSSHQYFPETTVKLNSVNQSPSPVIYADKASLKLFSTIDIMPYNIPQNTGIQQTYHKFIARPIIAKVKDSVQKPTSNLGVTEGYKFFNNTPTLDKHIVNVDDDNSEDLRQFLALIRKKIESKKKYPMSARNAGIEGRSEVKITILRDGQLEKVEIIDSSGSEILDNAALESVREANPFPPIPSNLGRDKIEMSIYLTFRIG